MTHILEIYCEGNGVAHERWFVARLVRTIYADGRSGWTVAREFRSRQHHKNVSGPDPDESDYNRISLQCACKVDTAGSWRKCGVNIQVHRGTAAFDRIVALCDMASTRHLTDISLRTLAARVGVTG
ncbi:hypothetical protein GOACH_10_00020 [Gordonia aichiensis NBRC 108223]|uniref:Uncharacterized protein n=1 Tax=Gordonia aichiensis NBRC 108223 TaxID=1220583 RepID=L7KJK1_9ACTN|nr:hypothetical protein GOACH_10_00020 [Gordonia aichiensis NBRC 108223]